MRAELGLPSVRGDDEKGGGMMGGFGGSMGGVAQTGKSKRPISVKFEIPYFTTSGIQVRYLKIIEPKVSLTCSRIKLTVACSCPLLFLFLSFLPKFYLRLSVITSSSNNLSWSWRMVIWTRPRVPRVWFRFTSMWLPNYWQMFNGPCRRTSRIRV